MALAEQIQALGKRIQDLCLAAGNAGLSVGVMQQGRLINRSFYGSQSASITTPPDGQTIHHLGSLSKALTAAGVAALVEEGKFDWDSRVIDVFPEFHQRNEPIERQATIVDLLAHRMGLAMRMNYWAQMEQELLVSADQAVNVLGALNKTADFRSTMKYNNWTYSVAGQIIERHSGMTLGEFMRVRFFEPLGLKRTTFGEVSDDNYASCHITLSDGKPYEIPRPCIRSGTVMAGAAGMTSCLDDLLVLYDALLLAKEDQEKTGLTRTPGSPFKQMAAMFSRHNKKGTTEYGLGWFLTDLPGEIGWIGINDGRVKKNPIIASGIEPVRIAYHNGSMPGVLSSVHLIPQARSVVVVLANTLAFADVPDYVGGMILETILKAEQPTDFLSLVLEAKGVSLQAPKATAKKLADDRKTGTQHKPLRDYEGRFVNQEGNFLLDVEVNEGGLRMRVQGLPKTYYDLYHYHDDVFAWTCDRDAEAKRGMFPQLSDAFRKIHFQCGADRKVSHIWWAYARDEPDGEIFTRVASDNRVEVANM